LVTAGEKKMFDMHNIQNAPQTHNFVVRGEKRTTKIEFVVHHKKHMTNNDFAIHFSLSCAL
jgi:hypothetical protein